MDVFAEGECGLRDHLKIWRARLLYESRELSAVCICFRGFLVPRDIQAVGDVHRLDSTPGGS